jgi:hypothetical protein
VLGHDYKIPRGGAGEQDRELTNKLLAERSGILNLALEGLDRLRERGWRFPQPTSGHGLWEQLEKGNSGIKRWIEDRCELGSFEFEQVEDQLYQNWRNWCMMNGEWWEKKEEFSKSLRAACPELVSDRARSCNGLPTGAGRPTIFRGIRLRKRWTWKRLGSMDTWDGWYKWYLIFPLYYRTLFTTDPHPTCPTCTTCSTYLSSYYSPFSFEFLGEE